MKAKRRGTLVYTERGYGANIKPEALPPSSLIPLVTTPTEVIHNPPPAVVPEEVCPHGGVLLGDKPVCGICSDGEQIGLALLHLARKLSYSIPVASAAPEDVMMTAVLAMVANQKKILSAREPGALAYTIGKRAVLKMYRPKSVVALAVGKMQMYDEEGGKLEKTSWKLEFLDQQRVQREEAARWANECYERARTFPGLNLVWNAKNFERLQEAIDEARRELPSTPVDYWRVIDMRLGYSKGMREFGWQEIADTLSPSWKPIGEWRVRRVYNEALALMRDSLVEKLLPQKNFNPGQMNAIGGISRRKIA
jgi:hypothetical protein